MSRMIRPLALAAVLAAPLAARATQAPHDASSDYGCKNCHIAHKSLGTALTKTNTTAALCDSCHVSGLGFGFPWSSGQQAQPGTSGSSHSWTALASNLGATSPDPSSADTLTADMGHHLDGGTRLKCTTCHDVHQADGVGGTLHASVTLGTNLTVTSGTGTGTLQLTATPAVAKAAGYVIKISGTNQFKLSHDNGKTYFGWNGTTWGADSLAGYANGKPFTPGTPVTLDDGITLVTFSAAGTFVSQIWQNFYVSYPFLRGTGAMMCVTCHRDRNQTWQNVEGTGPLAGNGQSITLGTTYLSHPVNQPLGANGRGYDRTGGILDANGALQSTGDGNTTNDLVVDSSSNVTCLSCHHPHNADSNSMTVDPR